MISKAEFLSRFQKKYFDFYNNNKNKIMAIFGGRHSGKSYFGALLCLYLMLFEGKKIYAFRASGKTAERDLINLFIGVLIEVLPEISFGKEKTSSILYYSSLFKFVSQDSQGFIICRGRGAETEDLKSFGSINFVWVDEATNFTNFEMRTLLTSVKGRGGDCTALLTSNIPPSKKHWLYSMFVDKEHSSNYKYLLSNFKDNPFIDQKEILNFYNETYERGSFQYLREVLGVIPESSQNNLIPNFSFENLAAKKYDNFCILIKSQINSLSILFVAFEINEVLILEEFSFPLIEEVFKASKLIVDKIALYNNLTFQEPQILYYKDDYKITNIINLLFKNKFNYNLVSIANLMTLQDFKLFSSFLKLRINKNCLKLKYQCEQAEWVFKEEGDFFVSIVKDFPKYYFLDCMRLLKFYINNIE